MIRLGYPCINLTLEASTSHRVQLASLDNPERLARAIDANFADAQRILAWNDQHGWRLFRLGSSFIPFASHPKFPYDWLARHREQFNTLAKLARQHNQRLSMHPGQYVNPASPDTGVVERSLAELQYAAALVHQLDPENGIVVLHLGGVYNEREATAQRFINTLLDHPDILQHLALENDETSWNVQQVLPVANALGVPVIVDTLHHRINPGRLSLAKALDLALPTWATRPKIHISSQDPDKSTGAHALNIKPADWTALVRALRGRDVDVMIEAKSKEQALPPRASKFLVA